VPGRASDSTSARLVDLVMRSLPSGADALQIGGAVAAAQTPEQLAATVLLGASGAATRLLVGRLRGQEGAGAVLEELPDDPAELRQLVEDALRQIAGIQAGQRVLGQALEQIAAALAGLRDTARLADASMPVLVGFEPLLDTLKASDVDPPALFRPTGPNWTDLCHGIPYRRREVDEILDELRGPEPGHVVLIHGEGASGKSVIARWVGFELVLEGRAVFHALFRDLLAAVGNLDGIVREIEMATAQVRGRPVFVIEDLHRAGKDEAVMAVQVLARAVRQWRARHAGLGADFVLLTRPGRGLGPGEDQKSIWEVASGAMDATARDLVRVIDTGDETEQPVANERHRDLVRRLAPHLWQVRWQVIERRAPSLAGLGASDLEQLAEHSQRSLWLLAWILAGHDGAVDEPFTRELAFEQARGYLTGGGIPNIIERCGLTQVAARAGDDVVPAVVLVVAAAPSDETQAWDSVWGAMEGSRADVSAVLDALAANGEIVREDLDGQRGVRIPHSALGRVYVAAMHGTSASRLAADGVVRVVRQQLVSGRALCAAVESLGAFREPAALDAAFDTLSHGDGRVRNAGLWSLVRAGDTGTAYLLRAIDHEIGDVACQVPPLLGAFRHAAPGVPEALVTALKSGDDALRAAAARGLRFLRTDSGGAAAALAEALIDRCADVQAEAAQALGLIYEKRGSAPSALLDALDSVHAIVRARAAEALVRAGAPPTQVLPALVDTLASSDWFARLLAVLVIRGLGPDAASAVPALADLLHSPWPFARRGAAEALGGIGSAAEPALTDLEQALGDPHDSVRKAAREAIDQIRAALEREKGGAAG